MMSNRNLASWLMLLCSSSYLYSSFLNYGTAVANDTVVNDTLVNDPAANNTAASDPAASDPAASDTAAPGPSPDVVYVSAQRGELRSGPADEFYPTGYLPRGTSLEVYHRTNDNWLGVRPPAGSFSWVPAADAYLLPGGKVIEITSTSAVSWIGTALGSAKQYRWQVQLKPGEQLSVLGEQSTEKADGSAVLWYKVSPPAGEFRWIQANTVSSKPIPVQATAVAQPEQKKATTNRATTNRATKPESTQADSSKSSVVTAAYQDPASEGVIVLGSDDYYDSGPMDGDIIYEGDVYEGEIIEGGLLDGEIVDGGTIDGNYFDGEIIEGDVIYEDGSYPLGPLHSRSNDQFAGWHAFELDDNGMRFTWLERLYTRARQRGPDPLVTDPFSLSMSRGRVQPASDLARAQMMAAGDLYEPQAAVEPTRRRPGGWRDPRLLRSQRSGEFATGPVSAPRLSGVEGLPGESSSLVDNAPPLTSGLDRVAGVLASARSALTNDAPQTNSTIGPAATNWYGLTGAASPVAPATTSVSTSVGFDLNQLQVRLSEIVTQPMQVWNLQAIYESARHYVEHGSSAIERGQARLLMERIEEFADLAHRSGYLVLQRGGFNSPMSGGGSVMLAGASMTAQQNTAVQNALQNTSNPMGNYDATGWLVPVLAASPGQPSHALTDEIGRILAYVSPVPGLNLDRYLNQAVGITGLRGYLPQLASGHIQAQRVVRIQ